MFCEYKLSTKKSQDHLVLYTSRTTPRSDLSTAFSMDNNDTSHPVPKHMSLPLSLPLPLHRLRVSPTAAAGASAGGAGVTSVGVGVGSAAVTGRSSVSYDFNESKTDEAVISKCSILLVDDSISSKLFI